MALDLKLKYEITSDRTKLIVTDQTGVYSVNNLGGWGAPNATRASLGLYTYVTFQPFNTASETVTNLSPVYDFDATHSNDYESVFEFTYSKDGWYRILLIALTEAEHEAMDDPEDLINSEDVPNIYFEDMIMVNLIVQKNCYLEKYIQCLECTACKCEQPLEDVVKLGVLIQGTDYRFHSAKQFEAQKMIESLTKQYKCCK